MALYSYPSLGHTKYSWDMGNPGKCCDLVEWGSLQLMGLTAEKLLAENILTIRVIDSSLMGIWKAYHSKTLLETKTFQLKKKHVLKNYVLCL